MGTKNFAHKKLYQVGDLNIGWWVKKPIHVKRHAALVKRKEKETLSKKSKSTPVRIIILST